MPPPIQRLRLSRYSDPGYITAAGAAGTFFGALIVMIATLALVARSLRPLPDARAFAAQLHGIRRFVHTAASDEVTPELLGWAGEWSDIAPPEVAELRWRERVFRRVDTLDYPLMAT